MKILFEIKYLIITLVFLFHVHKFPFVSWRIYFLEYCESEVQVVHLRKHTWADHLIPGLIFFFWKV